MHFFVKVKKTCMASCQIDIDDVQYNDENWFCNDDAMWIKNWKLNWWHFYQIINWHVV